MGMSAVITDPRVLDYRHPRPPSGLRSANDIIDYQNEVRFLREEERKAVQARANLLSAGPPGIDKDKNIFTEHDCRCSWDTDVKLVGELVAHERSKARFKFLGQHWYDRGALLVYLCSTCGLDASKRSREAHSAQSRWEAALDKVKLARLDRECNDRGAWYDQENRRPYLRHSPYPKSLEQQQRSYAALR